MPWAGLQASPRCSSWRSLLTPDGRVAAGAGPLGTTKRGALNSEDGDNELFDLVGAVGAGINASRDESLPLEVREVATDQADSAAEKLTEFKRKTT